MSASLSAPERPGGRPPAEPPAPPPPPPLPAAEPLPPRSLAAAAAAGLLAAFALPGERPGLGVLLVALAVAGATWGRPGAGRTTGATGLADARWQRAWLVLALLCAAVAVARDAAWVVWPALAGALGLGSLAAAGGATWRSLLRGVVAAPAAAPLGGVAFARAALSAAPRGGRPALPVLRGVVAAAVLLVVFGSLFATGDRAFAQIAESSLPDDVSLGLLPGRVLAFVAVVALVGGLLLARRGTRAAAAGPARSFGTVEWAIPLVALDLLFGAFVAVQFAVLFGGDDRVLQTAGLTYAQYAREGYGQLLVVAVLTLGVVGVALRHAGGSRRLLRALLALLCLLAGVVLASALHRLDLYQDAFGATRLRVTATATLLWLGAILALVLAGLAADRHAFLPRVGLLVTVLAGLGFALWNPDLRIAERNLARGTVDRGYLRTLSADARPALPRALEARRDADGWGGWNLARR